MISLREFDRRLGAVIYSLPASYKGPMEAFSFAGGPVAITTIALAAYISALERKQSDVQRAFLYGGLALILAIGLKLVLGRARPRGHNIRTFGIQSYSFPSGHAFGSIIFYGIIASLDYRYLSGPWNVLIAALIGGLIFLIGVSRVYLRLHFPSDVIGGWLLGGLSLAIVLAATFS
jgi:membrane-associated phospholipid phosphatase